MSSSGITIVQKKKRKAKNLAHGGWKVAMADMMISLMCLFLILWLLQVMDTQDSKRLVTYFQTGEIEPNNSGEGLGNSVSPIMLPKVATSRYDADLHRIEDTSLIEGEIDSQQDMELFSQQMQQQIDELDMTDSVTVAITAQGLRVVVSDSSKGSMFYRGSARMTPYYQDLLLNLAPIFGRVSNAMVITGHTDASRFKGSQITNWELSAERANRARYFLNQGGVTEQRIFQVSGMADTAPLNASDPKSSENRRIELFVLTREAQQSLQKVYKKLLTPAQTVGGDQAMMNSIHREHSVAKQAAANNQPTSAVDALKRSTARQ